MRGPVVHLTWHLDVGGGELFLRDLARELARRGVDQRVCTIGPPGALAPELASAGIPVTSFHKSSKLGALTIVRLAALLRTVRPAVVHTHGEAGLFWGLPAACLAGVPAVSLVYQNYPESWAKTVAARWLLRWPRVVVAGSEDVARFVKDTFGVPADRLATICCGIDSQSFLASPTGLRPATPTIVTVGRLVPRKGQRVLIEALPAVRRQFPTAEVVIVGDGPCRADLAAAARAAGVENAVRFAGTVHPTHGVLQGASVFVFPSLAEPQGLALLEAFAARVPVVASRTGGIPEMLTHEVDGLLVAPGDRDALAAAVCRMLGDRAFARACTDRAVRRIDAFDVRGLAGAYARLYLSVAPDRAPWTRSPTAPAASSARVSRGQ